MISLILSFVVLILGYLIYSRLTEKIFKPDSRLTPAIAVNDGVDCVPMAKNKNFLVQLLNIAGTGPIFGAIMGAVFGPIVFLWIIFGSILGGAVHDFMIGMISSRHKGASVGELSGIYIGNIMKWIMRIFSVILLILCGTVFVITPATILANLTPSALNKWFWIFAIVIYYFIATILPIDKIIGKFYPIFGALLIFMAVSIMIAVFAQGYAFNIPEIWNGFGLKNPNGLPTWPFLFITVACGAISGFHATQSPMVSKCIQSEKQGRQVFYGAMVMESVIALIWAAAGVAVYGGMQGLQDALTKLGSAGSVVYDISKTLLGGFGGALAIIGVVVCPITSGDTAFRGARLIIAETINLNQKKIINRLLITIPLIAIGIGLCFLDFDVLWRYFSWANQTLAMIALWIATFYLLKKGSYKYGSFMTALPACFMVAVTTTYIILAPEGFQLLTRMGDQGVLIGYLIGGGLAVLSLIAYIIFFIIYTKKHKKVYCEFIVDHKIHTKYGRIFKFICIPNTSYIVKKNELDLIYKKINLNKFRNKYDSLFYKSDKHDKFLLDFIKYEIAYCIKKGVIIKDSDDFNAIMLMFSKRPHEISFFNKDGIKFFFKSLFKGNISLFYKLKTLANYSFMNKDIYLQDLDDVFVFDLIKFNKDFDVKNVLNKIDYNKIILDFNALDDYYKDFNNINNLLLKKRYRLLFKNK